MRVQAAKAVLVVLLGALLGAWFGIRWVAFTTVYVPSANRTLLAQLSESLKTRPVEHDALEAVPAAIPDSDWMDVTAALLCSREACRYALEQSSLPASLLESVHDRVSVPVLGRSTLSLQVVDSSPARAQSLCSALLRYYNSDVNTHPLTTTSPARKRLKERCDKLLRQIRTQEKDLSRLSSLQTRRLGDQLVRPQGHTKNLIEHQRLARSQAVGDVLKALRNARRSSNDGEAANGVPGDPLSESLADKPGSKVDSLQRSSLTVRYQDLSERLKLERSYEDNVAMYRSLQIQSELLTTLEALESRSLEIVEPVSLKRQYSLGTTFLGALCGLLLAIAGLFSRPQRRG